MIRTKSPQFKTHGQAKRTFCATPVSVARSPDLRRAAQSPSLPRVFRTSGLAGLFDVTWITWTFFTGAHNVGAHPLIRPDSNEVFLNRDAPVMRLLNVNWVSATFNDQRIVVRLAARSASGEEDIIMKQDSFAADRTLIRALEKRSQTILCSEGGILFSQGDVPSGLYILRSGEAALMMKSALGNVVMCLHAVGGSLLGLPGVVGNEPYSMTAMVRKGSEVSFVTRNNFEDVIRVEPLLYPMVLRVLAAEVRSARQALSEAC